MYLKSHDYTFLTHAYIYIFVYVYSGTTTIHRPHGAGTIVIRPSATQRPVPFHKPLSVLAETVVVVKLPSVADNLISDMDTAASISTGNIYS